ncbi:MAG: type IV pilin [Candidatus Nanohalobium sp.]
MPGRKGVSAVIATVLLLAITVAMGSTLMVQTGNILDDRDRGELEGVTAPELEFSSVYSASGSDEMVVVLKNKGEEALNTSEFKLLFATEDFEEPVSRGRLPSGWKLSGESNDCLTDASGSNILKPGEDTTCETGVRFPDSNEKISLQVEGLRVRYENGYLCRVSGVSQESC